jgi:hypothetical protein
MMQLQMKIKRIKDLYSEVLTSLDGLTPDNFDELFFRAKKDIILVNDIKSELVQTYSPSDLKKYDKDLLFLAKQIEKRYDNIVESFTEERNLLSGKLKSVSNKKKIAKYSR